MSLRLATMLAQVALLWVGFPVTGTLGAEKKPSLVARPAYRVYELGEPVYLRCSIVNPEKTPITVLTSEIRAIVKIERPAAEVEILPDHPPDIGAPPIRACQEETIPIWPIDIGRDAKGDRIIFDAPCSADCELRVKIIVGGNSAVELTAKVKVHVTDSIYKYVPDLDRELRLRRRLSRLQTEIGHLLAKAEFEAIETFALENSHTSIGKNLLYQTAVMRAMDVPTYIEPREPARKLTVREVLEMSEDEHERLCRGGSPGLPGPEPALAARNLDKLIANDDGSFVRYNEAVLLLARQFLKLGKKEEAEACCRQIIQERRASLPASNAAQQLLDAISRGTWQELMPPYAFLPMPAAAVPTHDPRDLLEKKVQMVFAKDLAPDLSVEELVVLLGLTIGAELRVTYEEADIEKMVISGDALKTSGQTTLKDYLARVLAEKNLTWAVSDGRLLILHLKASKEKPSTKAERKE